jgi:ubiquinone/menaquinone biosynthesis C-methylase UbiE
MMGFYSNVIFPRLLDRVMAGEPFEQYRKAILSQVQGRVLELGFGTGLNLPHYPSSVEKLDIVDPNSGANAIAQPRIQASPLTVDSHVLSGEALPMADASFDSVVSTWTLCSIPNIEQAIAEVHRVLKPGGRFFFVEHGLSDDPKVQTWQHRLNPLQKIIGDGCHLNRDMEALIRQQFEHLDIKRFYVENTPKVAGYTYQGVAQKAG